MNFQNSNFTITRDNVRSYKITGNFRIIASLVNRSFRFDKQFFQRLIISYATEKYLLRFATMVSLCKHAN